MLNPTGCCLRAAQVFIMQYCCEQEPLQVTAKELLLLHQYRGRDQTVGKTKDVNTRASRVNRMHKIKNQ